MIITKKRYYHFDNIKKGDGGIDYEKNFNRSGYAEGFY